jgi:TolB-like protein
VGREPWVHDAPEGGLGKSGDRLCVIGRLTAAESGTLLWADRSGGTLDEGFDLRDCTTAGVVGVGGRDLRCQWEAIDPKANPDPA